MPRVADAACDKENAGPASAPRAPHFIGTTAMGVKPALGRDLAPAALRLGSSASSAPPPALRFPDVPVGGVKTVPLRVQNDTPRPREVRFEDVPRELGFLIDPADRFALAPGASVIVRVTWCPRRASAGGRDRREMRVRAADCPAAESGSGSGSGLGPARADTTLAVLLVGNAIKTDAPKNKNAASRAKARVPSRRPRGRPGSLRGDGRSALLLVAEKKKRVAAVASARFRGDDADVAHPEGGSPLGPKRHRGAASSHPPDAIAPVGKTLRLAKPTEGARRETRFARGGDSRGGSAATASSASSASLASSASSASLASSASAPAPSWVARQERAHLAWLNDVIAPESRGVDEKYGLVARSVALRNAHLSVRERLWALYSDDAELRDVVLRVEAHVDAGGLRLRAPADGDGGSFMEDVGLFAEFRDAIGAYDAFWLEAAADVVLPDVSRDVLRGALDAVDAKKEKEKKPHGRADALRRDAIVAALCRDEELELEYGPAPFADGYREALAGTVLKRVLLVAFLLDRAACASLALERDEGFPTRGFRRGVPLLFRADGAVKSSEALLAAALQASCAGEGDLTRHLRRFGYALLHRQRASDEYEYFANHLGADLRDGIRLCRLVDALGDLRGDASATSRATFPAETRAARTRNVRAAMDAAERCATATEEEEGVGAGAPRRFRLGDVCSPEDVVDGDLRGTFAILHALRMRFHAPAVVPAGTLERETRAFEAKKEASFGASRGGFFRDTLAPAAAGRTSSREKTSSSAETPSSANRSMTEPPSSSFDSPGAVLASRMFEEELAKAAMDAECLGAASHERRLLGWARAVAGAFALDVRDFRASFVDGSAFLALVHAYAPELVPLRAIRRAPKTLGGVEGEGEATAAPGETAANAWVGPSSWRTEPFAYARERSTRLDRDLDFSEPARLVREARSRALRACASNFALLRAACGNLRGANGDPLAPPAFGPEDLAESASASERGMSFVGRSNGAVKSAAAAFLVDLCAALVRHARERAAVVRVQRAWRRGRDEGAFRRRVALWTRAANTVARRLRGFLGRRDATRRANAILSVQATRRMVTARRAFLAIRRGALAAQAMARGWFAREEALDRRFATLIAQTYARGADARRRFARTRRAALTCQTLRRGLVARREVATLRERTNAATVIKAHFKGWFARFDYLELKDAATAMQARRRASATREKTRRAFLELRAAVVAVQTVRRGAAARSAFLRVSAAALTAQRFARGAEARRLFLRARDAATACQTIRREFLARRARADARRRERRERDERRARQARLDLLRAREEAEAKFEAELARRERAASEAAEAAREARDAAERAERAAMEIQRCVRGWIAREAMLDLRCAALVCQANRRGAVQRRAYARVMAAKAEAEATANAQAANATLRHRTPSKQRRAPSERRAPSAKKTAPRTGGKTPKKTPRRMTNDVPTDRGAAGFSPLERSSSSFTGSDAVVRTLSPGFRTSSSRAPLASVDPNEGAGGTSRRARDRRDARGAKLATERRRLRAEWAATTIAKYWRGFVARVDYALDLEERDANRSIATTTREEYSAKRPEPALDAQRLGGKALSLPLPLPRSASSPSPRVLSYSATLAASPTSEYLGSRAAPRRVAHRSSSKAATIAEWSAFDWAATTVAKHWRGWRARVDFAVTLWAAETCQAARRRAVASRAARLGAERLRAARRLAKVAQAAWRGRATRVALARRGGSFERLPSIRARLKRAYAAEDGVATRSLFHPGGGGVERCPPKKSKMTLGEKCAAAVRTLGSLQTAPRKLREVRDALRDLATGAAYSPACRATASDPRALSATLRATRLCDRSERHAPVLEAAYALFESLAAAPEPGPAAALFDAKDAVCVITEHMQMCRDRPALVQAATRVMLRLCEDPRRLAALAAMDAVVRRVDGIADILANVLDAHRRRRLTCIETRRPEEARVELERACALEESAGMVRALVDRLEAERRRRGGRRFGGGGGGGFGEGARRPAVPRHPGRPGGDGGGGGERRAAGRSAEERWFSW